MSSESESDEDFVPGEPEQVSEEESADEETDLLYEKQLEHKTKKRKTIQVKKCKKKHKSSVKEIIDEADNKDDESNVIVDPDEEKKREEELWAKFLEGTDTKPKSVPITSSTTSQSSVAATNISNEKAQSKSTKDESDYNTEREKRIFEFAGETIVVENDVIKDKIKTTDNPKIGNKDGPSSQGSALGGLSSVLGQLNKKNKLSTLEKSKLDWQTYKKKEGIEEEIQSHNKGKDGYLDKQDFLERADLRQYEIERELRMNRRSNR